ncbi:MAG TPA: hypothetical protein DDX39_11085 [Bacteroidales bacterium]|nr:MAG: hypothetical protein A2W98_13675 [Bacteroidetes bacterium GWF2_33_38]OFY73639.1 MAG: hypothetical protein A2265_04025 [Bacteroidetes bacterium RIFOXYA12_FULL_33_9]OFY88922.1 MAG: hypothetical protein A2236_07345 [Bacteroidetes bacterium RIFOXYA2_FULL_33_7]HBF89175.1 hypothetical protein [Bacteroidales bacterium]
MNLDLNQILNRAKNILTEPIKEWEIIKSEDSDKNQLLKNYVLPFAITIFVASFFGNLMFLSFFSFTFQFLSALVSALTSVLGVYISAYVITELSPSFNSKKNLNSTFKLVAYSFTASFVVSIVTGLIPALSILSIAGLYSLYLIYTGLTPILETSEDKKVPFLIVSTLVIIVTYLVLAFLLGLILTPFLATTVLSL